MAINSTANLQSKIDVTITKNTNTLVLGSKTAVKSFNNGYTFSFTSGVGTGNINCGLFLNGSVASGESISFDLRSIQEESFGAISTYKFVSLGAINFTNTSCASGANLKLRTTGAGATATNPGGGSNGFSNLLNTGPAQTGDLMLRPQCSIQFTDPYNTIKVTDTNRYVSLFADGGGTPGSHEAVTGICFDNPDGCWSWNMTLVGVTGA